MREFFKQYKTLLISLVLVLVGLHMVSSSIDDKQNAGFFGRMVLTIYEPIYKVINYPFGKVGGAVSNFTSISSMKEENENLVGQNRELQEEVNRLSELTLEVQRHAALLTLPEKLKLKENKPKIVAIARVIARPSSKEYKILVIDRGEKDGVKIKMAVVTEKGLVGHVVQTAPYASKVLLITDANSSVPAIIQSCRANTIAKGQSMDAMKLKFLQRNEDVAYGDIVITSGLGGIFPKGLVIGKISKVSKDESKMYLDVEVASNLNLDRVEEVALLAPPEKGVQNLLSPDTQE